MARSLALAVFLAAGLPSAQAQAPAVAPDSQSGIGIGYDPQVIATLLDLLSVQDNTRPAQSDFTDTSLKDLIIAGTPEGFYLRTRYLHLGVSLSQALAVTDDKRLKDQLVESARWERTPDLRAVALIAMAGRREQEAKKHFEEALNNPRPEIRFAGLEALEIWDLPEAKELYVKTVRTDAAPLIRIYAAQALARLGDPLGLETLRKELSSGDWLACAMAAHYLGDRGTGEDYDSVLDRMAREHSNDFVKAETAIAALKLFPKKKQ